MHSPLSHTFFILAYEDSHYLEECIHSLKEQTIKSQIFITTSTPSKFLEDISNRYNIGILINNENRGIASDWSFAYDKCTTEYVTLAHQDDIYLPMYTELCLNQIKSSYQDRPLIIFTKYKELINPNMRRFSPNLFIKDILLLPFLLKQSVKSIFIKKILLYFGNPIPCPTVLYDKRELGKFAFGDNFSCNMDWDAWLRLATIKGSFIYVNKTLVLHRINKATQTSKKITEKIRQREDALIFQRLWPKPIASLLAKVYSLATVFNKTK